MIYIRLVFKNLTTVPTEEDIIKAAQNQLDSSVRTVREITIQKLNNPIIIQNVTYQSESHPQTLFPPVLVPERDIERVRCIAMYKKRFQREH